MAVTRPLRVAALIKQIPRFEELTLGPEGRLVREGIPLDINPYCRRAVAKAVELARESGGESTVVTLGPPSAAEALREMLAAGADRAVHVCDPAFAGSDTLATAQALSAALRRFGPFDLVLVGLNSVDADTGQVGPELADLLGFRFASGVRTVEPNEDACLVGCERDDGWLELLVPLPAVLSVAERLCKPAKASPDACLVVPTGRIERVTASDLGPGPWGALGSPTVVGRVRSVGSARLRRRLGGDIRAQVDEAVQILVERGALDRSERTQAPDSPCLEPPPGHDGIAGLPSAAVLVEPGRRRVASELLGGASRLGGATPCDVTALCADHDDELWLLQQQRPFQVVRIDVPGEDEEAVAAAAAAWVADVHPAALIGPSTSWGRHVMSRVAARVGAGLTGDAIGLEVHGGRLVALKPAFGGQFVAEVTARSSVQMVTVRPGVLEPISVQGDRPASRSSRWAGVGRSGVTVIRSVRDDSLEALTNSIALVGVGTGVAQDNYGELDPLLRVLNAELVATRKVTDRGWLARSRQVGITGLSLRPRLYIALGLSGHFNHMVGVRGAGTVVAVNSDPQALVFDVCDVGVVGDWRLAVPLLTSALAEVLQGGHPLLQTGT